MRCTCPNCNHEFEIPVPTNTMEWAHEYIWDPEKGICTTFTGYQPYRCRKCHKRSATGIDLSSCFSMKNGL